MMVKEMKNKLTLKQGFVFCILFALLCVYSSDGFASSWGGTWSSSLGTLKINQSGNLVKGTYGSAGSIEGIVSGNVLKGTYRWSNKRGVFELRMSADGNLFTGDWSRTGASGKWTGKRISVPDKGESAPKSTTESKGRVRRLGDGLTQYTIWSTAQDGTGDSSGQTINMGKHTYCALTYVMSGGFQSACAVTVHGDDWILKARDPGPPDPYAAESQGCSAICFDR